MQFLNVYICCQNGIDNGCISNAKIERLIIFLGIRSVLPNLALNNEQILSYKNEHRRLLKRKTSSCPLQIPGIKIPSCIHAQHFAYHSFAPLTLHTEANMVTGTQRGLTLEQNNGRQNPGHCKHMAQAALKQQARPQVL